MKFADREARGCGAIIAVRKNILGARDFALIAGESSGRTMTAGMKKNRITVGSCSARVTGSFW